MFGELEIDPAGRRVSARGAEVALTQREFDLLLFLARHPGQAFTRTQLMDAVWQYAFYSDTSTVTVHMRRLRAKIEADPAAAPGADGVGRRLQVPAVSAAVRRCSAWARRCPAPARSRRSTAGATACSRWRCSRALGIPALLLAHVARSRGAGSARRGASSRSGSRSPAASSSSPSGPESR